jgi:hypothetical protein
MPLLLQIFGVLMVMTVDTEKFPVAAIRRIVIVVVIFVMNRELTNSLAGEFPPAPRTDPREDLERSFAIGLFLTRSVAPGLGNELIHLISI